MPIEELRDFLPKYRIEVYFLFENGCRTLGYHSYIYRLESNDSGYTLVCEDIPYDGTWEVIPSHQIPSGSEPEHLIDGYSWTQQFYMVQPGMTYDNISVPEGDDVFVVLDFKKQIEFNTVLYTQHGTSSGPKEISFYGSNDGLIYTPIKEYVKLTISGKETINFDSTVKYQYLKIGVNEYYYKGGNLVRFGDFQFSNVK